MVRNKKILLLGSTGKMGVAMEEIFKDGYSIVNKNSSDFNALEFEQVRKLIEENNPDIVVNTVALLGIDPCDKEPEKAFRLNTLYPKFLAELSKKRGFLLIHFSTDAVFNDEKNDFYTEDDTPHPLNLYGMTKYGGDCFVQAIAKKYYIFRLSVLFGETTKNTQFVEKMLEKVKQGAQVLKISNDIISSPTYSKDAAREVKRILEAGYEYGLYHIANEGKATLYELIDEIVSTLKLGVKVEKASFKDFAHIGIKNTNTPLKSIKIKTLRPWKEAIKEYCFSIQDKYKRGHLPGDKTSFLCLIISVGKNKPNIFFFIREYLYLPFDFLRLPFIIRV